MGKLNTNTKVRKVLARNSFLRGHAPKDCGNCRSAALREYSRKTVPIPAAGKGWDDASITRCREIGFTHKGALKKREPNSWENRWSRPKSHPLTPSVSIRARCNHWRFLMVLADRRSAGIKTSNSNTETIQMQNATAAEKRVPLPSR